jgi:hypothetical protein
MELFEGFGASLMTVSRGFANWVIALRLEVCFTISLRLFATAFPFSTLFIQSGFEPKP